MGDDLRGGEVGLLRLLAKLTRSARTRGRSRCGVAAVGRSEDESGRRGGERGLAAIGSKRLFDNAGGIPSMPRLKADFEANWIAHLGEHWVNVQGWSAVQIAN